MWLNYVFLIVWLICEPVLCGVLQKISARDVPGRSLGRSDFVERFEYEGHIYLFHLEPRSWEQAVEFCQKEGGYLAALEDAYEVNFVNHAMSGHLCTKTVFQNVWIGGRFFPDSGRWLWDATGYEIIGKLNDKNYPPWHQTHEPGLHCINLEQNIDGKPQFINVDCERKRRFLCEKGCPKLYNTDRGHWSPVSCLLDPPTKGDTCEMTCNTGLELFGVNPLNCAGHGWNNSIGINIIPDCKSPEEISEGIVEQLEIALDGKEAFMIFVLDDAVEVNDFELQKSMIAQLIKIFPPTASEAVNVVSSGQSGQSPRVLIQDTINQSLCQVLKAVAQIQQSSVEIMDRGLALQTVQNLSSIHEDKVPVIVLISGTNSVNKEAVKTASAIKHKSGIILTIGFGNCNADELVSMSSAAFDGLLYYRISNPGNFERVCQRLEQVSDFDNSHCENHADEVEIFIEKLNKSLAKNTNLMFLLNESTQWSNELLDYALQFIQSITLAFPLSRNRQAGLIAMHPAPNVAIPFKEDDSCDFNRHVAKISSGSGFENHGNGFLDLVELAELETRRINATGKTTIVVICGCNNHELENDLRLSVGDVFVAKFNAECLGRTSLDLSSEEKRKRVLCYLMDIPHDDCATVCPGLPSDKRGFWNQQNCTSPGKLGSKCTFTCHEAYELIGSKSLICTEFGWEGTAGDNVLPHCKTPEEIADAFVGKLTGILDNNVDSNFLFVLDESGSVRLENFETEIEFVDAVVDAFPLSGHRVAGLLTFSNQVRNLISLQTADTCRFIKQTKRINYLGGGTDIHKALVKANNVIGKRAVHPQTLVFLITDGISQSDPSRAAKELRDQGVVLFIIGVAGYKQEQLEPLASSGPDGTANFYGVKSFEVFNQISKYLNQTYHADGVHCRN